VELLSHSAGPKKAEIHPNVLFTAVLTSNFTESITNIDAAVIAAAAMRSKGIHGRGTNTLSHEKQIQDFRPISDQMKHIFSMKKEPKCIAPSPFSQGK
jgi:hypothetical protein